MVYQDFLNTVKSLVQKKLGEQYQVKLHRVLKNNGVVLDGLSILSSTRTCAPTIYLNSYYEELENGVSLDIITSQILLLCKEQSGLPAGLHHTLSSFDRIKDRVAYKLINAEENASLLSQIPYYSYLDLAAVFYLLVSENSEGQMTSLIHNEHLALWNVTRETLLELAVQNTPRLFPAVITPIEQAVQDLLPAASSTLDEDIFSPPLPPFSLYVLTNTSGINGAACLLYKDILKNFAARIRDDLIILPSSIHEVLLAPSSQAPSFEELNELITSINDSEVPAEDQLSNHLYCYCLEQDCIENPFSAFGTAEIGNLQ